MERILRGIMRYRHTTREQMVQEFRKVRDNPEVRTLELFYILPRICDVYKRTIAALIFVVHKCTHVVATLQ